MSKINYDDSFGGDSEDDNEDNLPYPEALLRSDFLSSKFDAATYLSTLSDRHQTLEDLQSDLRERSKFLSKELLDLVNSNYEQFLGLGSDLKGGEERVEDVRMGLLGFKSGVLDVREKVKIRKDESEGLLREKINIRRQISYGRNILEIDARLEELEVNLMVTPIGRIIDGVAEGEARNGAHDTDEEGRLTTMNGISQFNSDNLRHLTKAFCLVQSMMADIGTNHPYIQAQQGRIVRNRNKILTHLRTALEEARTAKKDTELMEFLSLYSELNAADEAIKNLKRFNPKK